MKVKRVLDLDACIINQTVKDSFYRQGNNLIITVTSRKRTRNHILITWI